MAPLNQERWSDLSKVAQLEIVGRVQRVFSYPWLYWQEQTWFISGRAMTTGVQVTVAFAITAATGMFMEHLLCVKSHGTHFIWYDVIWFLSLNRAQDFLKIFYLFIFTEIGEGREKERERDIIVWLPLVCPLLGTWPATQACALTGNWTRNFLVHRLVLNPLSHTNQG